MLRMKRRVKMLIKYIVVAGIIVSFGIYFLFSLQMIALYNCVQKFLGHKQSWKLSVEKINVCYARQMKILHSSQSRPLDFIPEPWEIDHPDFAPYIYHDVIKPYLELPKVKYQNTVTILTPVRNSEHVLNGYENAVSKLSYPHEYISVYFGENGSTDETVYAAKQLTYRLKALYGFKDAAFYKLNITGGVIGRLQERHKLALQLTRRSHLALARNTLLEYAMKREKSGYVLWIDSDIEEFPEDLIQQMLYAKSDVVTTPCYVKGGVFRGKYDKNSWLETEESLKMQQFLAKDELVVEGYGPAMRLYLPQMLSLGRVVPLDGVGGCTLLVRAECFLEGLRFPTEVYRHHIETEGLAKLARDMGYSVVGLPFVDVYHALSTATAE